MAVIENQEEVTERFDHIDFDRYVIDASFIYAAQNGIGYALGMGGVGLALTAVSGPLPVEVYAGLCSMGMCLGFMRGQRFMVWAFDEFNKQNIRDRVTMSRNKRDTVDTSQPVPVREEKGERGLVRVSKNEYVLSGKHYDFTKAQRESFKTFTVGDTVSRRRLEKHEAWRGTNINQHWSKVREELKRLELIGHNGIWKKEGVAWANRPTPPHN